MEHLKKLLVPGRYDLPVGETMVLTTRLPEDYHENTMAIRSSLQDVKFYINGTLRASYNTSETRLTGKNSASRYIFCKYFVCRCRKGTFVWNLQHIRVTTLVLSIRFTVEIKCRSGVIFSIITSLEP